MEFKRFIENVKLLLASSSKYVSGRNITLKLFISDIVRMQMSNFTIGNEELRSRKTQPHQIHVIQMKTLASIPHSAILDSEVLISTPISKQKTPISTQKTPISKQKTPISKPKPPISKPKTPISKPKPPISKQKTPISKQKAPIPKPKPPISKPKTPTSKPKPPIPKQRPPKRPKRNQAERDSFHSSKSISRNSFWHST
ncbi:merozoite surface protein CMZ-8-like [Penaeus japonicus]|uniref:merozoite surface protein CMZ-8-like n=1 Tax=Penaeus japonicus TaxID=27405 RepID=UPI001C713391|nr:merozoite surface protein CMZ-8-like [Penaeus japonicus]